MSFVARIRAVAGVAILGAFPASGAIAAETAFPSANDEPLLEFGAGWYLRGDVGYSDMPVPVVIADLANSLGRTGAVSGGLGIGYQFNDVLRMDFTVDRAVFRPNSTQPGGWCPSGEVAYYPVSSPYAGNPMGYLYNPNEQCTAVISNSLDRISPMVNAYLDLGEWRGFTPYIGAGVGFSYLQSSASVTRYQNWNGQPWAPNLGQNGVPVQWVNSQGTVANPYFPWPWQQLLPGQSLTKRSWKFSWSAMAGVSYDVTQNVKLDLHYRLLDAGSYTSLPGMLTGAAPVTKELVSQELRLGVRLVSD